ncbi:MAG TPA: polysaccharide deacetylase family protein [Candidatus Atribacteria bacterium]|nr:polysaccharide deacetylase family protein [Candidatus Atribacteria bacterium]
MKIVSACLLFLLVFVLFFRSGEACAQAESNTKLCALSFDDGPDVVMTGRVLDTLEKHNVVATFFLIGILINEETKPVLDRMVAMGCEIGNHSWAWDSLDQLSEEEIKESIEKTNEVIKQYTGQTPQFFRPPNLAVSDKMYDVIDLPFICGVLAYDWAGCDRTVETIVNNVLKEMDDGAIILLHDVQPEPHPITEVLDVLIPKLKEQDYEFVTISELFRRKGVDPNSLEYEMWTYVK